MHRGWIIAGMLAAAAAGAVFLSVRACAAAPEPASEWQSGVHYTMYARPQATSVAPGKVEVAEVFWYGCGHCYALDPALEAWKTKKPAFIEFVRIPVMWGPVHAQHARLYYTMLALGRGDLHPKIFESIHEGGNLLAAQDEAQARELHLAFFREHGVTRAQFDAAYDSAGVAEEVERAQILTGRYEIAGVPQFVVAGTYTTSLSLVGSEPKLFTLLQDLARREKGR